MLEVRVGDEIAGYRIDAVVGRGGMGVVYRATQLALERTVALKVIAPDLGSDVEFRERFKREARVAAQIKHPNVIAIHDARSEGDLLFISMDYIEGTDLRLVLRREGRLPLSRAVSIVAHVAGALDAAHRRGLVHRDVKPANVLIGLEEGREHVYLTDFGLTKSSAETGGFTAPGDVVGTVDYMAPEQIRGEQVDARTDVYALGCVLFHALTGKVPYDRDSDVAKLFAHATEPPPSVRDSLPDAPEALEEVVKRAMAKDPAARYATTGELGQAALAAVGVGAPASAPYATAPSVMLDQTVQRAPSRPSGSFPRVLDSARSRVPLAGRKAELERVLEALSMADGRRCMIALAGEPGMGKTRLAAELAREAHNRGAIVIYGRCYEDPLAPYQPFAEALRLLIASEGLDSIPTYARHELARLLPELRESVAGQPDPTGDGEGAARVRLFEDIAAAFAHAADRGPLLLVLDDLHWADRPTVMLLAHVLRSPDPAARTVVAAYRESELTPGHPFRELLPELDRDALLERVELEALDEEATNTLVSSLLEGAPSPELVRSLAAETGGNPFFIEQLVRHLTTTGALEQSSEGFAVRAGARAALVPVTVRELIRGRVQRLGQATAAALEAAAVSGQTFSVQVVAAASQLGRGESLDALEAADRAHLIRPVPQRAGHWTFAHALIRSALYEALPPLRRARLHALIADELETDPDVEPAELATHSLGAISVEGPARAVRAARLAGERALRGLAYEEATGHFIRALDALAQGAGHERSRERCELLLALGEAQARAADGAAAETFVAATDAARALGDPELLARAALGRCGIGVAIVGLDRARVEGLEEALELLGDRAPALRARLLARLAIEVYYVAGRQRSGPLSAEAVEVARSSGDADALLAALNARHVALWIPDSLDERLAVAQEMIELARTHDRSEQEVQGRNWRCVDLWEAGDIAAFEAEAAEHTRLANELRLPAYRWYEPLWQASLAALRGDYPRAEQLVAAAEDAGCRAGDRNAELFAYGVRLWLHFSVGRVTASDLSYVDERVGASPAGSAWRCLRAWFLAELGWFDEARSELTALAEHGFAVIPKDANWLVAVAELTETVRILDDKPKASQLYRRLLPYRGRHLAAMRAAFSLGSAEYALGVLAATMGNGDAAQQHFEAALRVEESWRARVWLIRTRLAYAQFLAQRQSPGDEELAQALRSAAHADAQALGLPERGLTSTSIVS